MTDASPNSQPPLPDEMDHIRWQQVIELGFEPDPNDWSEKLFTVSAGIKPASEEVRKQFTQALEKIEGTEAGQQLFRALLAKQQDPDYADGAFHGEKVALTYSESSPGAALESSDIGQALVMISPEIVSQLGFLEQENDTPHVLHLDSVLFHELVHVSDKSADERVTLIMEDMTELEKQTGLEISRDGMVAGLDRETDFFQSLSAAQQQALITLEEASNLPEDVTSGKPPHEQPFTRADVPRLWKQFDETLREHPLLDQQLDVYQELITGTNEAERLAMHATNEYREEQGYPFVRGGYDAMVWLDEPQPPGPVPQEAVTGKEKIKIDGIHGQWEYEVSEILQPDGTVTREELNPVDYWRESSEQDNVPEQWRDIPADVLNLAFAQLPETLKSEAAYLFNYETVTPPQTTGRAPSGEVPSL